MRKVDAEFAQGHNELSVFHNFAVEYIDARTEAILLRDVGWDVVPLLLERPALAIVVGGHVVAVRDWRGGLSWPTDARAAYCIRTLISENAATRAMRRAAHRKRQP